jgi:hypothetical protein
MIKNLIEASSEGSSVQFLRSSSVLQLKRVGLSSKIIIEISEEERDFDCLRILIIRRKLDQEQPLFSVVLQIVNEDSEKLFHHDVEPLCLFVDLRVIER